MQDWDLGPIIWRCAICEYQWYTVDELERRDENILCPHCDLPITKFIRPPWYTDLVKRPPNAPPATYLNHLRVPFAPIVGPDEASMVSIQTQLSGPLYGQPEGLEIDAMSAAFPFAPRAHEAPKAMFPLSPGASGTLITGEHWSVTRLEVPKAVFKPPPPEVPVLPKPHPPTGNGASPPSSQAVFKAPPPHDVTAPSAYIQGKYRGPVARQPVLMIATPKFGGKALPPNIVRSDIAKPITGVLPQSVPKPPPPMVPIGPPLPEGQLPPYVVPKPEEQLSVPPVWAKGVFNQVARDQVHTLPPVLAPLPMPPPQPVGEAPAKQTSYRLPSTTLPDSLSPTQAANRADLTTIAIHPWPAEFESDSPTSDIARIRSQYGESSQCDRVLLGFSKKLYIILRHNTSLHKDLWITCVDKSRWPHGIVWPIDDFCRNLGKILNFTKYFGSLEFRDVFLLLMPDCEQHLLRNLRMSDWDYVTVPKPFALKWFAICAFERPRIAKLCSTKYDTCYKGNSETKSGRIVVDKVLGVSAI